MSSWGFPWIFFYTLRIPLVYIPLNPPRHPANSYLFPPDPRQFLYEYVFPSIPLHRSFQFLLLPMTKKRTLGKVQIERYLDSFPYTSLSLRCCCSRYCRLVGDRVPIHPQILVDHLTLYQPGGAGYAHHITTGTPWNIRPSYGPVQLAVPRRRRFLFLLMARTTIWYTLVPSSL